MDKHDTFYLLETKVMDRIFQQMWECSIDNHGSIFATSTCFNILKRVNFSYKKDYERNQRFKTRNVDKIRHHSLTYMSFIKSMSLRYRVELLIFIVVMFLYQKYFIDFQVVKNNLSDITPELFGLIKKFRTATITPNEGTRLKELNAIITAQTPKAVTGLFKGLIMIIIALGFSVKTMMVFLRNLLTKQSITFRWQDFIDFVMAIMTSIAIIGAFRLSKSTQYLGNDFTNTF